MDGYISHLSCFCLTPISLYVIYLVLEHKLFLPAPKQSHEEQPHIHGAHMPCNGKRQMAAHLHQRPCCIADKAIPHLWKPSIVKNTAWYTKLFGWIVPRAEPQHQSERRVLSVFLSEFQSWPCEVGLNWVQQGNHEKASARYAEWAEVPEPAGAVTAESIYWIPKLSLGCHWAAPGTKGHL